MPPLVTAGFQRLLTALVLGAYALAVAGLVVWATALRSGPAPVPRWSVGLALLVVAVTLPVVYRGVDPAVHDLVHGQHDGVGAVLADLGHGLDVATDPEATLEALAATTLRLLRVPFASIEIWPDPAADPGAGGGGGGGAGAGAGWAGELTVRAGRPVPGAVEVVVPTVYRGETIGQLRVGGRRARQPLSGDDRRLTADVARHLALMVSTARLGEALHSSRRRLVVAAEEERRRIRRDLHDGLGPTLASLKLQVAALRRTLGAERPLADPSGGVALADLDATVAEAAADIRRLVDGLRPPMLDDLGLVDALRHLRFVPSSLQLTVSEPEPLGELPAAVEVALYRVAVEAVHNTVRHAGADTCAIHLARGVDQVTLTVTDDGRGQGGDSRRGLGHRTMQERVDELGGHLTLSGRPGGGTVVSVAVPLAAVARP